MNELFHGAQIKHRSCNNVIIFVPKKFWTSSRTWRFVCFRLFNPMNKTVNVCVLFFLRKFRFPLTCAINTRINSSATMRKEKETHTPARKANKLFTVFSWLLLRANTRRRFWIEKKLKHSQNAIYIFKEYAFIEIFY